MRNNWKNFDAEANSPVDKSELEAELGGVDVENPGLAVPVQAEDLAALDPGEVDGQVQRPDDPVVPVRDRVLDVVGRCVHEHAAVVPGPGLHSAQRIRTK
jgi:hypothetical protein